MIKMLLILGLLNLFIGCKPQSKDEKILATSSKIVESIRNENVEEFISFIAFKDLSDISKDKELVTADIKNYNSLFKSYIGKNKPIIEVTDLYNYLGQQCVRVEIYNNKIDSSVSELHLDLLFGPESYFGLEKISGYALIKNNSDSSDFKSYSYWQGRGQ
ncbi:hypothetical protein SAMN05192529_10149 [Arachidicoccus rhizosphaerae]|uniref:DUF5104 domain-containing protein n=1 Tax=Arachidicoccus rhizosphaerae TaxID=551991 RepID=A0A1H3VFA9_9BACT|nr:hypothetical protein [Arachidicoccus rhizosphaerae]SDZ73473.1 hypothetical protein SAMN05192529_10149 [Arachidicoccus rhizosphaerae]